MIWKTKLWGVEFTGGRDDPPRLIGRNWMSHVDDPYKGEPTRALLFCTRADARIWCNLKELQYVGRDDVCAKWRFRPVRVVETVKKE